MLDRPSGTDQAGEGFDLLLNPFVLLRVGLEADAREINRAYEDAAETGAATIDILQRARQTLLTPRLRIDAELGAFFDTAAALAAQIVDLLRAGSGSKRLDDLLARLSPLVQSNLRAHLASRKPAVVSELTALLRAQAATSPAAIRAVIEATRQKARCGQIEPDAVVNALDRLQRRQCRAAIDKLVDASGYAGAFSGFVRDALATDGAALIGKLELHVDAYRTAVLPELSQRRAQVTAACDAVREDCKDPAASERLLKAARHWNEIAEPLEIFEGRLDRDEPYAREVYEEIRKLCSWLWDRKDYEVALAITLGCIDIFRALPRAVVEMREDAGKLSSNIVDVSVREGKLDRAIEYCEQAIALDPRHAMAFNNRGVTYERRNQYDLAIADYSEAIRLNPDFALAYKNRGWIYNQKKEYDRAIADFDRAIRLDPDYAVAYEFRGDAFYYKKDYDAAIADYGQVIRIKPDSADIFNTRGWAHYCKGDYARAIADYDEAIRLNPDFALAYKNRGLSYCKKLEYDRAIADLNQAIRLDPDYAVAYVLRAWALHCKGDYDRAIADYSEAIRIRPDDMEAFHYRGMSYYQKEDYDCAIVDFSQAIQIKPDYFEAFNERGRCHAAKKDYDRAIADYSEAIRIKPDYAVAYYNRGLRYDDLKDYDRAIADYSQAIGIDPDYAHAYNNRGVIYEDNKKDYARAIADYDQALRIDPHYERARNNRASAYKALHEERPGNRFAWKHLFWLAIAALLYLIALR